MPIHRRYVAEAIESKQEIDMKGIELSSWMDDNELEICDLDDEQKMEIRESCDEASYNVDLEQYISENRDELFKDYKELNDLDVVPANIEADNDFRRFAAEAFEDSDEYEYRDNFPIWCTGWDFPSSYSATELNDMGISGVVFFDFERSTYVSLTACGQDMSPSIYTAYALYSSLNLNAQSLKDKLLRDPKWFIYVVGKEKTKEYAAELGITDEAIRDAEEQAKKRMEEFNCSIEQISKLRDEGKISKPVSDILAISAYLKSTE